MEQYPYTTGDLCHALLEAKIVNSKSKHAGIVAKVRLSRWAKKGKFIYPKTEQFDRWRFSQRMIDDIVKAFSPGGKGRWSVYDY